MAGSIYPLRFRPAAPAATAMLAVLAAWAYWPTLGEMAWRWGHDPQYSYGYLVPFFALYLLWARRQQLQTTALRPAAWGLALLGAAVMVRLAGAYFHYSYLDQISLLPSLGGLVVLAGGPSLLKWSWPAIAFLAFMVPLPHSLSLALSGPMQAFATMSSTFFLQVLGRPAVAEGNIILLNEIELGIVEACSGLRMLVVFFALSTAVAMLIRKPLWERVLIAFSAIPIALASNILRITATGLVLDVVGNGPTGERFHDIAGLLMPLPGLAFLGLEMLVLGKLLVEPDRRAVVNPVGAKQVEINPVAMYRGGNSARRERRTVTVPAAATPPPAATVKVATDVPSQAPPEPASAPVARS